MSRPSPADSWLEGVYHAKTQSDLIALYDGWAETYDADMQGIGYVHPAVIAGLVGRYVPNKTDADFRCGRRHRHRRQYSRHHGLQTI